ncbi:MAG: hypothetical protein EOP73_14790 [Variovorax sp.]|nr:MAG: hypothetical protein EOP73_14790 [Variovorax sp.]
MTRAPVVAVLAMAAALLLVPGAGPAVAADADAGGVTVRALHTPRPGADGLGELALEITDTATGRGLDYDGRRLAAWLQRSPPTLADGEIACSDKVRVLASQGIGRRAAVDFNTHGLVTINDDRTVAFINPFLGLRNAKLEGVVQLPGDATAHLLRRGEHELWIAMRERDAIAVIDTDTHAVARTIAFAPGSGPQALAADGRGVWVGFAGRDNWLHFDRAGAGEPDGRVDAPAASRLLASPDGRLLGLDARGATLLDPRTRERRRVALPGAAVAAWSALSGRWLVGTARGRLAWIDPADGKVDNAIDLGAPVAALVTFDDGRHAAAALAGASTVAVVDVATTEVRQTVAVVPGAADLASSATFLYAHGPEHGGMTLLSLADLRAGRARPVHVAIGAPASPSSPVPPPTAGPAGDIAAPVLLAPAPDRATMLVASVHDGQIYQYAEGMMAPIGSFSNYRRRPLALLLVDHGLEPLGQGRYRATFRHARGGEHELVVSGVQPRFAACVRLTLPEVPDAARAAVAAAPDASLVAAAAVPGDQALRIEVRLRSRATRAPLGGVPDLVLLAFDRRSGWQRRVRLVERADGTGGAGRQGPDAEEAGHYVALLPVPARARRIDLLVSSASQDLPYGAGLIGTVDGPAP